MTVPVVLDELHTTFMAHELAPELIVHEFGVMLPEAGMIGVVGVVGGHPDSDGAKGGALQVRFPPES